MRIGEQAALVQGIGEWARRGRQEDGRMALHQQAVPFGEGAALVRHVSGEVIRRDQVLMASSSSMSLCRMIMGNTWSNGIPGERDPALCTRSSLKERSRSRGLMCPFLLVPGGFQARRRQGRGQGWSARLDERPLRPALLAATL